ncbi:type II secretion system protein [Candidatus Daviesbacteria bacterium]|nr:type II secretion system protein [Candidatus Daviesbacteria bacterium]
MKESAHVRYLGFTLVELLVVIAIVAILAAVVVLIINPLELTRRGRDAARLTDLANLQSAINIAVQESTGAGAVAVLCSGSGTYPCNGSSNIGTRVSDGTGWVKVNLSSQKSVSLPTLPVDPVNNATYHYAYCANNDAWEIDAVLESDQQKGRMESDGGNENATDTGGRYEVGSNLTLIAASGGSCTY